MHEAEYNLAVAEAVGAATSDKRLTVPINEEARQQARQLIYGGDPAESVKRPLITMHPGSGGYSIARRWAPERFAQLADKRYHDAGGQLILLGGPDEAALHKQIMDMHQAGMT